MGGHGHHDPYKIPDYKIYRVDNIPELMATKRALAAQGLCDPWLRNEAWRYNVQQFGTEKTRVTSVVFRGFRVGFAAFLVTIIGSAVYDKMYPSQHGHGHGHH